MVAIAEEESHLKYYLVGLTQHPRLAVSSSAVEVLRNAKGATAYFYGNMVI